MKSRNIPDTLFKAIVDMDLKKKKIIINKV